MMYWNNRYVKLGMKLGVVIFTLLLFFHNYDFFRGVHLQSRRKGHPDTIITVYKHNVALKIQAKRAKTMNTTEERKHTNKNDELPLTSFPNFPSYKDMLQDDTKTSKLRQYPEIAGCPYLGLRKPLVKDNLDKTHLAMCNRRAVTRNDCIETVKYFGQPGSLSPGKCETDNGLQICTVQRNIENEKEDPNIACNTTLCKDEKLSLGIFDEKVGKIKWRQMKDLTNLQASIRKHLVISNFAKGFVLIRCGSRQATQVLIFPKILRNISSRRMRSSVKKSLNINIVLEDSLSRAHFYRTMTKTVRTFREIIHNESIPSTVLEFEKIQSYASNTYGNLQRLFTGQKYLKSKIKCDYKVDEYTTANYTCTYGIEEMLERYRTIGYSTLLQEDNCWHDYWGSFIEPRYGLGNVEDERTRLRRWHEFVKLVDISGRKGVIDDHGISMLSCDVYEMFNTTNLFNSFTIPHVCYSGKYFSSYFLKYLQQYVIMNDNRSENFLAYTHLATPHDSDGKRGVDDDASLSELFRHAAELRNTVTIFVSDHGGKVSRFAAYTTQGRQEVFQPLLFMIIPHEVSNMLGNKVMDALVHNQNRLVGLEDLYQTLVSIAEATQIQQSDHRNSRININPLKKVPYLQGSNNHFNPTANSKDIPNGRITVYSDNSVVHDSNGNLKTRDDKTMRGLFNPIPLNRTCKQMKLNSDSVCLCDGMDITVDSNDHTLYWAAEYAVGTINNRIQQQYTTASLLHKKRIRTLGFYGYGACQRYTLLNITHARKIVSGSNFQLIFNLLAKPYGEDTVEIFDVDVSLPVNPHEYGITLDKAIRVSPFNKYESCADKGVDVKLCTCHANEGESMQWRENLFITAGLQIGYVISKPVMTMLDTPCLALILRNNIVSGNIVGSYEAVNACPFYKYTLEVKLMRIRYARFSLRNIPLFPLLPKTVTYLFTAQIQGRLGVFMPSFKYTKIGWKE